MAYSVDWIAKVISIPTSDLTLVSGTRYSLQMSAFLGEIRRLEAVFAEGLWAPQILDHTNPKLDFAGVDYAGFDELINGYTLQVTGIATRVDLLGSNNNIVDVLIATGVSVVPSNSAGLQLVSTGSGLSSTQDERLKAAYDILRGKYIINRSTGNVEVYDDANTLLFTAPAYEDAAGATPVGAASEKIDRRDRFV